MSVNTLKICDKYNISFDTCISVESMFNEILQTVYTFNDEQLKNVAVAALEENREKLFYYPASSNHHVYQGGLLHHIYTMLKTAKGIVSSYPWINAELLYTGIILHDLGKLQSFVFNDDKTLKDLSEEDKYIGHIVLGYNYTDKLCTRLNIDNHIKLLLENMILSHHGEYQFGSPKIPSFPEAFLLHIIDKIDYQLVFVFEGRSSEKLRED